MARARRISVPRILEEAADLLEEHGWTTLHCYDRTTGGMCALGAIAAAVFPQVLAEDPYTLNELGYVFGDEGKPRRSANQVEAVQFFADFVKPSRVFPGMADQEVYYFNDGFGGHARKSADQVVAKLREAAAAYREQRKAKTAA